MDTYSIEKDVPISTRRESTKLENTLKLLLINDSFLIPETDVKAIKALRQSIMYLSRRHNLVTATRVVEGGLRVWRTH